MSTMFPELLFTMVFVLFVVVLFVTLLRTVMPRGIASLPCARASQA